MQLVFLCCAGDTKKLWFNIEKPLKRCLSTVHLREVASQQVGIEQQWEIKAVLSVVDPDSEQCCGSVNNSFGSCAIPFAKFPKARNIHRSFSN